MATVLISLALALVVGLVIWRLAVNRRKGKSGCGSCSGCAMSAVCRAERET